jgi:uncharacterized protein YchJ
VERDELLMWSVEAGYSESYVRSLICQVMVELGKRQRAEGAGRKTPPEAMALMRSAFHKYGDQAPKFLLAAYRAAKKLTAHNHKSLKEEIDCLAA